MYSGSNLGPTIKAHMFHSSFVGAVGAVVAVLLLGHAPIRSQLTRPQRHCAQKINCTHRR